MKKLMYIFLILPLIMSGCKGKKETERGGMPSLLEKAEAFARGVLESLTGTTACKRESKLQG